MISSLLHLVGLRPRVYYTLTNFRGGGAWSPWAPPQYANVYSVKRRFERYTIIYIWKILESMVPNLSQPITYHFSDRRGRLCYSDHVSSGRIGTLSYNSFRWRAIRLFNCLLRHVRNMTSCSTVIFKKKLDQFLCNLDDKPCIPHFDNSVVNLTKE